MKVEIDDDYVAWVQGTAQKALKEAGLTLTNSAETMIAGLLHAQVADGFCRDKEHCIAAANELLDGVVRGYRSGNYGFGLFKGTINENQALHIITEVNKALMAFPWLPL
ncbi:MAG: hypothetical protein AAF430_01445 [Myxococcota bacterium]